MLEIQNSSTTRYCITQSPYTRCDPADIPQGDDAAGSAFGYGLLTDQETDAIIVTTTHSGVLDSETQNGDASDPIWHNHYVRLGLVAQCDLI